ncbi:MAG: response regulator [Chloroflexi bacterium]|nr:response regulator [Chloroflexota bacterium]
MATKGRRDRRSAPVILIVDDDAYVHSTLSAAMRGLRHEVLHATTATDGLRLALAQRPALAIIDVGLPDLDGYALTRAMRDRVGLAAMRICILTGHLPDETLAATAGADAIVCKPFRLDEFLAIVREQLGMTTGED